MSSAPGAALGEPAAKRSNSQDVSRQIDNLDCRLRQLEEDRVTYFLPAERNPGVVAPLKAAGDHYKNRAPQRGQPPTTRKRHSWQLCSTGQRCKTALRSTRRQRKRWMIASTMSFAALRKPSFTEKLSAIKTILPYYTSPVTDGKRGGNVLLLLSQTRSQQTCPIIRSTATLSSQRPWDTHVFRTGSDRRSTFARSAYPGSIVQMKLDRYAPRAASGRRTGSVRDCFSPKASSDTGRCVGVRAAVPPRDVREADEEARALNQLPS